MSEIQIATSNLPYTICIIDPIVLLGIMDHYIRRPLTNDRVIGTLMGYISKDGEVEIKNCYPVPHEDSENGSDIKYDVDHHEQMLTLHRKLYPEEIVVGWYATGSITNTSMFIHKWYTTQMQTDMVHLLVSTDLSLNKFDFNVYIAMKLTLNGSKTQNLSFFPIQNHYEATDADRNAFELFSKQAEIGKPLPLSEYNYYNVVLHKLSSFVKTITCHVEQIIQGKQEPDVDLARFLQYIFSLVSSSQDFDPMFANSVQDSIVTNHLSSLIKSYLTISEKNDFKPNSEQ